MRKLLLTVLLICFSGLLHAADNNIYITQYDKVIGKFSPTQFEVLIKGASKYEEIMLAQKEEKVSIICYEMKATDNKGEYKTTVRIIWLDQNNKEVNFIESELILNIDNDASQNIPQWRITYRNIAEIGFPITGGFLIIVLIILL